MPRHKILGCRLMRERRARIKGGGGGGAGFGRVAFDLTGFGGDDVDNDVVERQGGDEGDEGGGEGNTAVDVEDNLAAFSRR